jgi:hypothetical protein
VHTITSDLAYSGSAHSHVAPQPGRGTYKEPFSSRPEHIYAVADLAGPAGANIMPPHIGGPAPQYADATTFLKVLECTEEYNVPDDDDDDVAEPSMWPSAAVHSAERADAAADSGDEPAYDVPSADPAARVHYAEASLDPDDELHQISLANVTFSEAHL